MECSGLCGPDRSHHRNAGWRRAADVGCTTDGGLYGIDTQGKLYTVGVDGVCTYVATTDFVNELNYSGCNVIQSMGYDHNTGNMYWYAHSQTATATGISMSA